MPANKKINFLTKNPNFQSWFVAICLSTFAVMPFIADKFYPNTGLAVKNYLATRIFGSTNTSSLAFSIVWAFFMDISLLGPLFGMWFVPSLTEKFGRMPTIRWSLIGALPGHLMQAAAGFLDKWVLLFIGRFVCFFFYGIFQMAAIVLLAEISNIKIRGKICTTMLIGVSLGTLLGTVLGLESVLGSDNLWPMAYVVMGLITLPMIPLSFLFYDSPVFLVANRTEHEAAESLSFYQGPQASLLTAIEDAKLAEKHHQGTGCLPYRKLLSLAPLKRPLKLSFAIQVSIGAAHLLNYFSTAMLMLAGFSSSVASYCTVSMKVLNVFAFLLSLLTVDCLGRRPLINIGCIGGVVSFGCAGIFQWFSGYHWGSLCVLVSLFGAQIVVNFGLRPLNGLVAEMFPHKFRSSGKSFSSICGNTYHFILVIIYYVILNSAASFSYLIVAGSILIAFLYLWRNYPETNGKIAHEAFPELKLLDNDSDNIVYGAIDK